MSPRLRVMHVIEAMHQGGAESMVLEHVRHASAGVETIVCALNRGGPALEEAKRMGARVEMISKGSPLEAVGRLASRMRALGVEVVNGHNPTGALYGVVAARLAGVGRIVRTEHSLHYPGRHSRLHPLLETLETACSSHVICVCRAVLESHAPRMRWAARRFVSIANGISDATPTVPRDAARRALGIAPEETAVLTVGSLTPQKAQDVLLNGFASAARRGSGGRLLIAGEGRLRDTLEAQRDRLGIGDRVTFLGARHDVVDLMGAADVFVLSSIREGLSVTLLESMRAGLPAVATAVGGNAEAISQGVTGLLVPVADPRALGEALEGLVEDPAMREAQGREARARWQRSFTAERMVRETEALYRTPA